MKKTHLIVILIVLFLIGIIVRLSPHPMNFTPVFAIALFAGAYLSRKWSVILPLSIMLLSDIIIGFYDIKLMLGGIIYPIHLNQNDFRVILRSTTGEYTSQMSNE